MILRIIMWGELSLRHCEKIINLSALIHNVHRIRTINPHSGILAMIKANAYGHGLIAVANTLKNEVQGFGTAVLDEAIALRDNKIDVPIFLMQGIHDTEELNLAAKHQ